MLRSSAAAVLCILTGMALPGYGQTTLAWKLKEGDKFYLESASLLNQTIKSGGMEVKQDIDQTLVSLFTVKKKNADNTLTIEQKIETVLLKTNGPVPPKAAQALEGAVFTFTLNPKGEVTKFSGFDDLIKKLTNDNPAAGKEVRRFLTEDLLKMTAQETFGFVPDKAVKKGDKWERKFTYPLGPLGTLTSTNKYTAEGTDKVDGKNAERIAVEMSMTYAAPKPEGSASLEIKKGDLKVEGAKGTIYFDAAAGRLVRSEATIPSKGIMTFSFGGRDTDMELDQKQTIKNRVLDKNPLAK
jgi:hypothetical protein